ncbi:MAG: trypsin-like peptidase domain-containing protein [Myxococcales bacterium]|jgi:Do/DeqQ family serine protease|nr:trypsin-like peptidase domain-containing protein [Myxococcales bacterium]
MRKVVLTFVLALSTFAPAAASAQPAQPPPPSAAQVHASQAEAKKLSDAFVAVAEKVGPSVVQLEVTAREEPSDPAIRAFRDGDSPIARGSGSGVILSTDGAILTNNHVIDGALSISVRLRDGRLLPAKLVGRDPATDLAVIRVEAQNLPAAKLADSDQARVGEWVVAIGAPFGLRYTVTAGVLSAKGRGGIGANAIEDYLQTDASINPGNSGGPLCDIEGRVLGINTMIVGRGSGIGFAVPSNMAKRVAEQIVKNGRVQRAWLGVGFQDLTPDLAGAFKLDPSAGTLVTSVADGGPAQRANLKPGDVIASVGGKPTRDGRELIREVLTHDVGQTVPMEIIRDGKRYGTQLTLAARPEAAVPPLPVQQQGVPQAGMGFNTRDLSPAEVATLKVSSRPLPLVTQVVAGSVADRAGLKAGDLVLEVDGVVEPSTAQLQEASKDGQLVMRVRRRDSAFYTVLKK